MSPEVNLPVAEPPQAAPTPEATVPRKWFIISCAVCIVLLILSTFASYSWKQTVDKLSKTADTYSSSVTITEPVEVGGKIVFKTTTQTVHDVKTQVIHDKTVTTIKSGCTLGLAYSTRLTPGLYLSPDLFPFGPGNVQALGLAFSDGQFVLGAGYRLNF